jgi:hypothetical protein
MVELVEVDVVGAEAAQRTLDRVEDVLAREPLALTAPKHFVAMMKSWRRPARASAR